MDDIVVKSKRAENHIKDLKEVFRALNKYKVMLDLEKCMSWDSWSLREA